MNKIDSATNKFEVIFSFLNEQLPVLEDKIKEKNKEIEVLNDTNVKVQRVNQEKLENASSQEQKRKIENDIKFNNHIYSLELRKRMMHIEYYKSEIKKREMYFIRCMKYINYITALNNKNEILINQNFYAFTNYLSSELINNYKLLKDFYLEQKDIHDSYTTLLKIYSNLDEERKEKLKINLLSNEEYENLKNKIKKLEEDIEKYKNKFKCQKPNITEKVIDENICFNFEVFKIVDTIYDHSNEFDNSLKNNEHEVKKSA